MTSAPFDDYRAVVRPEWIDDNGHLNMGYYVVVFDYATDAWLDHLGLSASERERMGVATFTLESHVNYLREVLEDDHENDQEPSDDRANLATHLFPLPVVIKRLVDAPDAG